MHTREIATTLLVTLLLASLAALHAAETTASRPNVVFIVIDNADYEHFGKCYGGSGLTPHMHRSPVSCHSNRGSHDVL